MLKNDQYQIQEEFGNQVMPHQLRVTHIATGITVVGNCKSEMSKPLILQELIGKLESSLPADAATNVDAEKADLQRQLLAMQAQINALLERQNPQTYIDKVNKAIAPAKKRGRPAKAKPEAVAPTGYSVLDPTKVTAPPPSVAPAPRSYKPGHTVAVSNKPGIEA